MKEAVELCYAKEDKRIEDFFNKQNKKQKNDAKNGKSAATGINKADIPLESVTIAFKQELFEGCVKKIQKRINAKKKKAKANDDLKSVSKKVIIRKDSMASTIKQKTFESKGNFVGSVTG